jgi:hypothetical protein
MNPEQTSEGEKVLTGTLSFQQWEDWQWRKKELN